MNNVDFTLDKKNKRYRKNNRFKCYGIISILISICFMLILFFNIIYGGYTAFYSHYIKLPVYLDSKYINTDNLNRSYRKLWINGLKKEFPQVKKRKDKRELYSIISYDANNTIKDFIKNNPDQIGKTVELWLKASSDIDMYMKGKIDANNNSLITPIIKSIIDKLVENEKIDAGFNSGLFTNGDSRYPEQAGILGGIIGSCLTIISCMIICIPIAVATAIYLEEYAPKNRLTDFIEVNLNNLTAIPSIIFGLLGLSIFINIFGMPRSSALVGGVTLSLMVLPTIVITTRNAIKAIPKSIIDGVVALGASKIQTLFHFTIPLSLPGIMTGIILAISRAIGETAPLIMIGMIAFIVDIPKSIFSPTTTIPVQIYLWADSAELGFKEKTYATIMILIFLLIILNSTAIFIRKKFANKWQ